MISADNTQSWLDQHESQALLGSDIEWLAQQRASALARFAEVGLPGVRDEQWRYTNLRALKSQAYSISEKGAKSSLELAKTEQPRLVFVDGHLDQSRSFVPDIDGLIFNSTASVIEDENNLLNGELGSTLPQDQHGFTALNTAFFQDGYVLRLARNTVIEPVLEVVFIASSTEHVSHTRNVIMLGANSQCSIVERHIGPADCVYLNNSVTEVVAGDNAHLDHYKIQQESGAAFHVGGVFINQAKSSQVKNHNFALSGLITRNDTHCNLLGEGAHMEMNGLVLGKGREHIDNHTQVNHAVPNCTSDEYYKTVLDEQSRSVFRGRIIVAQDAQLTNADQQNNNLLLSKTAEADTKPQLEIYADDVKCSHGATVGQLDPKSMFYLQSRGIDSDSARALLTFAFANEVINRIKVEPIKQELTKLLAGELLAGLDGLPIAAEH